MEQIKYETVDIGGMVNRIPEAAVDKLPFGLVKLDLDGKILQYNMAESSISGIAPADVIGKNFFLDVALCTQRPEFFGAFKEGVDKGFLNTIFDFTFDYNMEPTRVRVHLVLIKPFVYLMVKRVPVDAPTANIHNAPKVKPSLKDSPLFDLPQAQEAVKQNRVEDFQF
jgi:photoactive yellow protein